jgi:hypothetical protein
LASRVITDVSGHPASTSQLEIDEPRPIASTTRSASIRSSPTCTAVTRPCGVPPPSVSMPLTDTPSRIFTLGSWRTLSRRTRSIRMREP